MELFIDVIGWIGSIEVVAAYFLISQNRVENTSVFYQMLNLTGAIFLILNTVYYKAYPSSFINLVWVAIAIHSLLRNRTS